jgi:hypothetical protein
MKKMQPIWIGFINPKDLKFISVYTIYREKINDEINFRGEKYKLVNSEWGCYVKQSEYNKLFMP